MLLGRKPDTHMSIKGKYVFWVDNVIYGALLWKYSGSYSLVNIYLIKVQYEQMSDFYNFYMAYYNSSWFQRFQLDMYTQNWGLT